MEKTILDILNAGIGLFQSGREGLAKAAQELEKTYAELVQRGSQDNSEAAIRLRETVDRILNDIREFTNVAGKNYEETRSKIIENYNRITEEIKNKMPEGKVEEVRAKINEVAESIKTSASKSSK